MQRAAGGGAVPGQRGGGHGALGQEGTDDGGVGSVQDVRRALEADPDAIGGQGPVMDTLGVEDDQGLGKALQHGEGVVHAQRDLLHLGLVDHLGEAAPRNVVTYCDGVLAPLDVIVAAKSPCAREEGSVPAGLLELLRDTRVQEFFREGPHQAVAFKGTARNGKSPVDLPKGIYRQFTHRKKRANSRVRCHRFLPTFDE